MIKEIFVDFSVMKSKKLYEKEFIRKFRERDEEIQRIIQTWISSEIKNFHDLDKTEREDFEQHIMQLVTKFFKSKRFDYQGHLRKFVTKISLNVCRYRPRVKKFIADDVKTQNEFQKWIAHQIDREMVQDDNRYNSMVNLAFAKVKKSLMNDSYYYDQSLKGFIENIAYNVSIYFPFINKYIAGDTVSQEEAKDWILSLCKKFSALNESDYDDIIQEVKRKLLIIFRENRFNFHCKLSSYVGQITKFTCLDYIRNNPGVSHNARISNSDRYDQLGDKRNPEEVYYHSERKHILATLLKALKPDCTSLIKDWIGGMSYLEMAEERGIPLGTVKSRIYTCIRKLMANYKNYEKE